MQPSVLLVYVLVAGALYMVSCARALHSQEAAFDPARVQSRECQSGRLRCGFNPPTAAENSLMERADSYYVRPRGMPTRYDLTPSLPPVGNQGQQNSCLGWALSYGLKSYYEKIERGWEYDAPGEGGRGLHVFSPSFLYNQINGGEDRGATPREAFRLMMRRGSSPWAFMPYREDDFRAPPGPEARSQALAFRSENFRKVSCSDPSQIKSEIMRGNPVMIGVRAHLNFYQLGDKIWENHEGRFFGGHAVILSGFDDDLESDLGFQGAFRIYNSFGEKWGEGGLGWVAYDFMPRACIGAYVLSEGEAERESLAFNFLRRDGSGETGGAPPAPTVRAPRGVQVSRGAFADRVKLGWERAAGAIAYRVERDDGAGFETLAIVDDTAYVDTRVRERIAYSYRIVSLGTGSISNPGRAFRGFAREVKKNEAPGPVFNLRGDRAARFVQLDWEPGQGAREHEIARWDEKRGAFRVIFKRGRSRFRDRRPLKNATNYYRVRGVNRHGKGPWSEPVGVKVAGPNVSPGPVRGLTVTRGQHADRIELEWLPVTGATRYRIRRFGSGRAKEFFSEKNRFVDRSVEARTGEVFRYMVNAEGRGGRGRASAPFAGSSRGRLERGQRPSSPGRLRVQRQPERKRITLNWKAAAGAREYRVYRQSGYDGQPVPIGTVKAPGTSFTAPLFGGPGTLYLYTVRSRNAAGVESPPSRPVPALVRSDLATPRSVFPYNGGLREFTGRWTAFTWDGPEAGQLDLFVAYTGRKFQATILRGGKRLARFSGDYIARDRELAAPGFRMVLDGAFGAQNRPAAARIRFETARTAGGKEIVFTRDVR